MSDGSSSQWRTEESLGAESDEPPSEVLSALKPR